MTHNRTLDGALLLNSTLQPGETPVTVGSTPKLLTVIEFEIAYAPPEPENATEISVSCPFDIEHTETGYTTPQGRISVETENGVYRYIRLGEEEEGGVTIFDYWPYFVVIIIVAIVLFIIMKRRAARRIEV